MKQRDLLPELMDDPGLNRQDHISALRGLQRINRWTNMAGLAWQPIEQLACQHPGKTLRVLDIATGSADLPVQIWQRAKRASIHLEIEACDVSEQAVAFARENCRRAGAPIKLFTLDVLHDLIPAAYDIVLCSTFLHHLTHDQTVLVLDKMARAASRRVVAVDLVRGRLNWLQVWLACRLLSRSRIVHYDGPQSIRASYTLGEVNEIVRRISLANYRITSHWPCRFVLVGDIA